MLLYTHIILKMFYCYSQNVEKTKEVDLNHNFLKINLRAPPLSVVKFYLLFLTKDHF